MLPLLVAREFHALTFVFNGELDKPLHDARGRYRPVLDGLIFGLSIGLVGRAIARAYLELDVAIVDPWMLVVTPIPLICAAFFACYLPARRAAAVDPNVALRSE